MVYVAATTEINTHTYMREEGHKNEGRKIAMRKEKSLADENQQLQKRLWMKR